jgi:hypothetical protein
MRFLPYKQLVMTMCLLLLMCIRTSPFKVYFFPIVFGSLDMSRSNSMTNAGQCRLAPLIPCIQDSSQVYDFIVKLLFKLHNCMRTLIVA